jgi:hypothetical protein
MGAGPMATDDPGGSGMGAGPMATDDPGGSGMGAGPIATNVAALFAVPAFAAIAFRRDTLASTTNTANTKVRM